MDTQQFKADICKALAHPTRIAILELLRNGAQSASAIVTQLGIEHPTPHNIWQSCAPSAS